MTSRTFSASALLFFLAVSTARTQTLSTSPTIAKWYNNCAAAISLTYDDGRPKSKLNKAVNKFVFENGLTIDYEVVTYQYILNPNLKYRLLETIIPANFGYFGHGHKHVNHDRLSYEEALKSFAQCYKVMVELGLKPVAYAYPGGAGKEAETKKALAKAGFLSGRLHFSEKMNDPYIIPGSKTEPDDWFGLPTLIMQDYNFNRCKRCVTNNEQLIPYLEQTVKEKAWLILTYHAIGNKKNYGYFRYEEFQKNIHAIKERNFWNASMNAVTLYIRERLHAEAKLLTAGAHGHIEEMTITVTDNLPNTIYNQPLTVLFQIPKEWVNQPIALEENGKQIKIFTFPSLNAMISLAPDETERKLRKLKKLKKT
ncbi:MAG TPA: hypothetical protein VK469_03580 [Candidatus Kapabacteria bacterium]|nr:hypothetical protein [Candidatus Kapabacteria bacterium]